MDDNQKEEPSGVQLFDNFRKLVTIIDKLRDAGLQEHISQPRIAVVGSQSSGKSSLLEYIVGMNFLPRGSVQYLSIYFIGCSYQKAFRAQIGTCKEQA